MEGARHKGAGSGVSGGTGDEGGGKLGWREWARVFFGIDRVGRVYRMLLRSGQMYYLCVLSFHHSLTFSHFLRLSSPFTDQS